MKVVILAGGLPSTINDDNDRIPKPMVEIGERPILWHIMKLYSHYGLNDFIICTGYRANLIKQYFLNYYIYRSDITVDLQKNDVQIHNNVAEPWTVTVVDTGLDTSTAERIKRIEPYVDGEDFIVSYGDCILDLNITEFIKLHKDNNTIATAAVAKPTGRNAALSLDKGGKFLRNAVAGHSETEAWVNACNILLKNEAFRYLNEASAERFEIEILNKIAEDNQVSTYKHDGFWSPVETMRDKIWLESLWEQKEAIWKVWKD